MSLAQHLQAGASLQFRWGHSDCCLWAADWVRARRGVDPASPLRGRYGTAFTAYRHIARLGGFEAMVRDLMTNAGLSETSDPVSGDIGIVVTDQGLSVGIKTQVGWAAKAEHGITCAADFRCIAAWSI